jgi:hypothetical protein
VHDVNNTEAVALIGYLNRAGLVGAMEGQGAVWADALSDITSNDAQEVARGLARNRTSAERWVTPGDIRSGARAVRAARLMQAERDSALLLPPPATDDVGAEVEWTRAYRRALGDGLSAEDADVRACKASRLVRRGGLEARPVVQLVAQVAGNFAALPPAQAARNVTGAAAVRASLDTTERTDDE